MQHVRRVRQPKVTTRVSHIGIAKRADTSRQLTKEDAFSVIAGETPLIPPYSPDFLEMCVERSNMLKQCIAAMVVNVTAGGYEVVQVHRDIPMDDGEVEEANSFIASVNSEESLSTMLGKTVCDYETYGYAYIEIIRDRKGRISLLRYMPAATVRLLPKDEANPQPVTYDIARGKRVSRVTEYRAFRRYVQIIGGRTRFFKEFGDQRDLNMDTGKFDRVPLAQQATEVIHLRQHSPTPTEFHAGSTRFLPCWGRASPRNAICGTSRTTRSRR